MNDLRDIRLVCLLGTGPWQRDIFDELRSLNLTICTISPDRNDFGSDMHIYADVRDVIKIEREISDLGIHPIFFISSQTDLAVSSAAELNVKFQCGLDQTEAAKIFTNKYKMRAAVEQLELAIRNPKFLRIRADNNEDDIRLLMDGLNVADVVIKPTSLQSSLGVHRVGNFEDFDFAQYVEGMKKYGIHEFILEELIEGVEYTVEGYKFKNGEHKIFGVSTKEKKFGFGVANALNYSPEALENCQTLKEPLAKLFACYKFGPTHTELIFSQSGEFFLVEAACRAGGSGIPSHIVPSLSGFYPERQLIADHLSAEINILGSGTRYEYVSLIFFEFYQHVAHKIEVGSCGSNIIRVWCQYHTGDSVHAVVDDRSRHGFVIIGANSSQKVLGFLKILKEINPGIIFHD